MKKPEITLKQVKKLLEEKGILLSFDANGISEDLILRDVHYHSGQVTMNSLFVCKGAHFSPRYLLSALDNGGIAYVSEQAYDLEGKQAAVILVQDIRKAMAYLGDAFSDHAWEKLHLIGITGTKGKSTTAYFMRHILDAYLKDMKQPASAILSGIDNYDGVIKEESHLTTPETLELHQHFANAVSRGIEYLTMEVSSQALKYERVLGVRFHVGCFLNIGEDHISDIEHDSFEDYFQSKLLLFRQCDIAVVNMDIDFREQILEAAKEAPSLVTYGIDKTADIYAKDIQTGSRGTDFTVCSDSFCKKIRLSMPGYFNVYNALAAISISYALHIPMDYIEKGLKKAKVSGRMEVFRDKKRNIQIVVDYAHNKMSFESLFAAMKKDFPESEISIVFGCPGKKAQARRKELGSIAGRMANKAYITEEDAGEEPVLKICEEIASHISEEKEGCECFIIEDREEAIRTAIRDAADNSVILITGKGRETRQKRGLLYIPVKSDVDIVKEILLEK